MSTHRVVVEISRTLEGAALAWPDPTEAASNSLEANHHYVPDIRLARWEDVERAYELETKYLPKLHAADDAATVWEALCVRMANRAIDIADDLFIALDPGVASATLALGAMGCIPFWSCNGGVFGGHHVKSYPCIQFFARAEQVGLLLQAAAQASAGLQQDGHGRCSLYANAVEPLRRFARHLLDLQ